MVPDSEPWKSLGFALPWPLVITMCNVKSCGFLSPPLTCTYIVPVSDWVICCRWLFGVGQLPLTSGCDPSGHDPCCSCCWGLDCCWDPLSLLLLLACRWWWPLFAEAYVMSKISLLNMPTNIAEIRIYDDRVAATVKAIKSLTRCRSSISLICLVVLTS